MGSEYPSAKKEPPWLPILPPMPRISVSTNSRARLSHRRPILLSPPTPLLPPAATPTPSSPPKSVDQSSAFLLLETPLSTLSSASSPSPVAAAVSWSAASSPGADSSPASASAPAAPSVAVSKPESICSLRDGDFSGNRSSSACPVSELVPANSEECISTNGSNASASVPILPTSSPAALQQSASCEGDDHRDIEENAVGLVTVSIGGVQEGKDPDFGRPSEDGCTSRRMEFSVAEPASFASCLDAAEEVDEGGRGCDIRVDQENCSAVGSGAGISSLVKDAVSVADEGELEEGQLSGDGANEAKDLDVGEAGEDGSTSSDMGFSVAMSTSSVSCVHVPEVDEFREVDVYVESCSDFGREGEIPHLVKKEEFAVDEGELEEGQLPGEWSGVEESEEDSEPAQSLEDSAAVSSVVRGVPNISLTGNVAERNYYSFQVEEVHSEHRGRGNNKAKGKKKKKHKKGEGSKKRSREKSKEKYNEVLKKRRAEGKWVEGVSDPPGLRNKKDCSGRGEKTRSSNSAAKLKKVPPANLPPQPTPKKPTVDEGPEDGEILLESAPTSNGLLSSLVEAEVGLWTTDNVDDEFVTEMEQDGTVKKKRGPETAERKLKRKIAKRKKRAQKERELGIRRPPRTTQSKPVKVLCTHYMKGRCAKGDQCTYSHDAVPLTKLEPCKFLMSHSCLKGDDCPYSHDLRAFPCKFFHTRGLCYDGENCQFSHGAISEDALEKLKQRVDKEKKERLSSTSAFDIPTPSFSTPLPPELDPDPLGWGTLSAYSSHEEQPTQITNPSPLDQSNHFYGDFNLENHAGASAATDIPSMDRTDAKFDAASPLRIEETADEYRSTQTNNSETRDSGTSLDWRGFSVPMGQASTDSAYASPVPQILKTPVCPSLPNERNNVRGALEVSQMEGTMDGGGQSASEETFVISNDEPRKRDVLSVPNLSPLPARIVAPVLRGRQIGSFMVESQKSGHSPSQAESKRHHTVESLLGEALRR